MSQSIALRHGLDNGHTPKLYFNQDICGSFQQQGQLSINLNSILSSVMKFYVNSLHHADKFQCNTKLFLKIYTTFYSSHNNNNKSSQIFYCSEDQNVISWMPYLGLIWSVNWDEGLQCLMLALNLALDDLGEALGVVSSGFRHGRARQPTGAAFFFMTHWGGTSASKIKNK